MIIEIKWRIKIKKIETMKEEGIIEVEVEINKESWRGVHISGDMDRKMESIREWMEEADGIRTLIGEDFNARFEEGGGGE